MAFSIFEEKYKLKSYTFKETLPFGFEIKDLARMNRKACSITGEPHRTSFYQIIRITRGKTIQQIDFTPVEVSSGQILFIGKDQVMSFDVESEYQGEIILFTDEYYIRDESDSRLIKQIELLNPFTVNTPIVSDENIGSIWELIKKIYKPENDNYTPHILHHLLSALLIYSERINDNSGRFVTSPGYQATLRFSQAVEENYRNMRKVNEYVVHLGITPKALSRALKSTIGKSPKQYIDDRLLLEAKRLLVYSNKSVKEISFELGFEEPTNFSKFFKEQVGQSPVDFKKQQQA